MKTTKREEEKIGFGYHLFSPVCVCTLIVSFGSYVSLYYFPIIIITLITIVLFLKTSLEHRQRALQSIDWNVRTDLITHQQILRNKSIGIPGKSQQDLDKFHMYTPKLRNNSNKKTNHCGHSPRSYHFGVEEMQWMLVRQKDSTKYMQFLMKRDRWVLHSAHRWNEIVYCIILGGE